MTDAHRKTESYSLHCTPLPSTLFRHPALFILTLLIIFLSGCQFITDHTALVTFDSQGGTPIPPLRVFIGGRIPEPQTPQRDGFTFTGWYTNDGEPVIWDFSTHITDPDENITLSAGWELLPDTVYLRMTWSEGTAVNEPEELEFILQAGPEGYFQSSLLSWYSGTGEPVIADRDLFASTLPLSNTLVPQETGPHPPAVSLWLMFSQDNRFGMMVIYTLQDTTRKTYGTLTVSSIQIAEDSRTSGTQSYLSGTFSGGTVALYSYEDTDDGEVHTVDQDYAVYAVEGEFRVKTLN